MGIFNVRPKDSGGSKEPSEKPKPGFFGGRPGIDRRSFRDKLARDSSSIPGTGGQRYTKRERIELEKDFGKKHGSRITKQEFNQHLKDLSKEKYNARGSEKIAIDRKIRYFKQMEKNF